MDSREALIALNMIDHVGPVRLRQLLQHVGSPEAILGASRATLAGIPGIGAETAEAIVHWQSTVDLQGELRRIREYDCRILIQSDPEYPAALNQIYDPPMVLYVRGRLEERDRNSIALVGSRQVTPYGMAVSRRFAQQLCGLGMTVVSGGARGIDTAAHQGALSAKGRTIAVLGTGINLVFPSENVGLFEEMVSKGGALVTQFPFNRPADKQSFPIRNRIVAGMTLGTVVIEANLTSGALITANFAADYGRHVFAVPGRIDSPRSKGCHELLRKGARLCEGVEDILSEFEYLFSRPALEGRGEPDAVAAALVELPPDENALFEKLGDEPVDVDELVRGTGLSVSVVLSGLIRLEMKRLVRALPGKRFVRRVFTNV